MIEQPRVGRPREASLASMRLGFLLPLVVFLFGCDPAWNYRVVAPTTVISATTSTPLRLELVHAGVFSLSLDISVKVINATTSTIELESPAVIVRDARDGPLTPDRVEGCRSTGGGPFRLAAGATCQLDAFFRVNPGTLRAHPRLRTLAVRIEAKVNSANVLLSLPPERTF